MASRGRVGCAEAPGHISIPIPDMPHVPQEPLAQGIDRMEESSCPAPEGLRYDQADRFAWEEDEDFRTVLLVEHVPRNDELMWGIAQRLSDDVNDVRFVYRNLPDDDGLWSGLFVDFVDHESARKALALLASKEPGALGQDHCGRPIQLGDDAIVTWADEDLAWVQKLMRFQYCVTNFYWERGVAQGIARSVLFDQAVTCLLFAALVFFIASAILGLARLDGDQDTLPILLLTGNWLFFFFFSFEWVIRFAAFKRKRHVVMDWCMLLDFLTCCVLLILAALANMFIGQDWAPYIQALGLILLQRFWRLARCLFSCCPWSCQRMLFEA